MNLELGGHIVQNKKLRKNEIVRKEATFQTRLLRKQSAKSWHAADGL